MFLTTHSSAFTLYLLLISSHGLVLLSRCLSTVLGILLLRLHSFSPFDLAVNKTSHLASHYVYSSIQAQSTLTFLLPLLLLVTHHVSSSTTGHEWSLILLALLLMLTGIDMYFRILVSTVRLAGEYCSELMTSRELIHYS